MRKEIKIVMLILFLVLGFFVPYLYSSIQGNYAISVIDSGNSLQYHTCIGDNTNGMWVNVKTGTVSVTGNVTVVQPTGTNLHTVLDSGTLTSVTNAVTVVQSTATSLNATVVQPTATQLNMTAVQPTASQLNATVIGTKTNNNAAPGSTNIGALSCLANAVAPSYTEGDLIFHSCDLGGFTRVESNVTVGGGIVTIDSAHARVHLGEHFRANDQESLATTATFTYLMITAATPTFTHWGFKFESETEEGITVYEGATVSGNGTSISIVNSNRNNSNPGTLAIYATPTVTGNGTIIYRLLIPGSGLAPSSGAVEGSEDEFILKQNTNYIVGVHNYGSLTGIHVIDFKWYEITGVGNN